MPPVIFSRWNRISNKSSCFTERQRSLPFHRLRFIPWRAVSIFTAAQTGVNRATNLGGGEAGHSLEPLLRVPGTLTPAPVPYPSLQGSEESIWNCIVRILPRSHQQGEVIIFIKLNLVTSHKLLNIMGYLLLSQKTMKTMWVFRGGSSDTHWKLQMPSRLYWLLTHTIPALQRPQTMNGRAKTTHRHWNLKAPSPHQRAVWKECPSGPICFLHV